MKLCSTHANVHKGSGTLCSFVLPIRQPLLLVRFAALFAMKRVHSGTDPIVHFLSDVTDDAKADTC